VNPEKPLLTCDSCGIAATQEHLQRRTTRLELSTRYRPIHIRVLVLALAPPAQVNEYFYYDAAEDADRSVEKGTFACAILEAAGIQRDGKPWKDVLAEFQAAGWFLAYCVECPAEEWRGEFTASNEKVVARFAPSLMLRITHSYKPKWIAPVGAGMDAFVPVLAAECGDRLRLDDGRAFNLRSLAGLRALSRKGD
jgi:hypothetical protein